jgi:hypothetical protein
LIRSLRVSTQRSTSVLFSFVLCLLIVAGSFAIRQSEPDVSASLLDVYLTHPFLLPNDLDLIA